MLACSSSTLTNVLPQRNAMLQTHAMTLHPVTVYRHGADLSLCSPLCVVITSFFMKVLHNAGSVRSCIIILEKMKPETTAAIPKGITTGYNEMVTLMHSQTRWPSIAIDLISVILFRAPQPLTFPVVPGLNL